MVDVWGASFHALTGSRVITKKRNFGAFFLGVLFTCAGLGYFCLNLEHYIHGRPAENPFDIKDITALKTFVVFALKPFGGLNSLALFGSFLSHRTFDVGSIRSNSMLTSTPVWSCSAIHQ